MGIDETGLKVEGDGAPALKLPKPQSQENAVLAPGEAQEDAVMGEDQGKGLHRLPDGSSNASSQRRSFLAGFGQRREPSLRFNSRTASADPL